ncbi:amidohydrolase family protein [Paraburkholderia sp. J41]|uniref:amidohydrolase family protein n=1 Tax=Paraburkholderia sp. J41 TaxID=2805433 RepID=UPI002AC32758|nr:amidohydrolase family protein [Paraburkholderia sp. J41]
MISEAHMTWLAQRARAGMAARPAYEGETCDGGTCEGGTCEGGTCDGGAHAASVDDVIHWGTAGGANVLGLTELGRIAPGAPADLAIYRLDDPRYFGLHRPAIGPVASGGRPVLKALFAAGEAVVVDDAIPGLGMEALGREARAAVRALMAQA